MSESRALAEFVARIQYRDLGPEVIARAKDLILDQIGLMLGISKLPWSKVIFDYARGWGDGTPESTIAHYGYKTKAENAAFVNSSFSHGFEMDDLYIPGSSHPGCVTVPSALAMAERESASGQQMILAVVAGYEVMGRISAAITPSSQLRGFHTATSITGPFGAAAAAGKLLGLDAETQLHALAIAGSHSAGVTEYDQSGGTVKRMHAGMASHAGIRSALLAQKGLTGPASILEGKHGVCQAFADEYKLNEITDGLGADFRVTMGTGIKAYCACGGVHAAIDALKQLTKAHGIKGSEVEKIVMGTNRRTIHHIEAKPVDITSAQFSAAFSLALTLERGGNGFNDYTEETLRDPVILDLSRKVDLEVDKDIDKDYPRTRAAKVTVTLRNGKTHQARVDYCKGTPENPLSAEELRDKFRGLASAVADADRMQGIIQIVQNLDQQKDLSKLVALISS